MTDNEARTQLVDLVDRIVARKFRSEEERDELMAQIRQMVPHPAVANVIYHSTIQKTTEQIVDELLSYRPILLGGS